MLNSTEIIKKARESGKKRNFNQSFELIISLHNMDTKKKDFNLNEVIYLPNSFTKTPRICVFASGDIALRANKSNADRVIESEELDKLASLKRELRKISNNYTFFLAEASFMPRIGKIFGPYLGPKGKMPTPLTLNMPIEEIIEKYRIATRIRSRNQLNISCKIGDENMEDSKILKNSSMVINEVIKKLPQGQKNIKNIEIKLTMSSPIKMSSEV